MFAQLTSKPATQNDIIEISLSEPTLFENINWYGIMLGIAFILGLMLVIRRIARRYRRREKDSLELATWATAGIHKSTRIFRKYGRTVKTGLISRIVLKWMNRKMKNQEIKYKEEFRHFRTKPLIEEIKEKREKENELL